MENEDKFICIFVRVWSEVVQLPENSSTGNTSVYVTKNRKQLTSVSEPEPQPFVDVYQTITCRVVVVICALGLIGNIFAFILLLYRKRHGKRAKHSRESRSSKADIHCFIALCLSDFCLCLVLLPQWILKGDAVLKMEWTFTLFYQLYEELIVNVFIMTSTCLTVSMTTNRYIHLSHPLWALKHLGHQFLLTCIFLSIIFSICFNIPRYWLNNVVHIECLFPSNTSVYYVENVSRTWEQGYRWMYFTIGILIPLCTLTYSNARIIHAICRSAGFIQRRNQERNIITKTLICVVFFYITLVSPTELIKFFDPGPNDSSEKRSVYLVVNAVANLLQSANFAFNFVPYMILDKSVRQKVIRSASSTRRSYKSSVTSQSTLGFTNGSCRGSAQFAMSQVRLGRPLSVTSRLSLSASPLAADNGHAIVK